MCTARERLRASLRLVMGQHADWDRSSKEFWTAVKAHQARLEARHQELGHEETEVLVAVSYDEFLEREMPKVEADIAEIEAELTGGPPRPVTW